MTYAEALIRKGKRGAAIYVQVRTKRTFQRFPTKFQCFEVILVFLV